VAAFKGLPYWSFKYIFIPHWRELEQVPHGYYSFSTKGLVTPVYFSERFIRQLKYGPPTIVISSIKNISISYSRAFVSDG